MKFSTAWVINILLITLKMDMATSKSLPQTESIDLSRYGSRLFGSPSKDVGLAVANWKNDQSRGNPEELGTYLEGDILFPSEKFRNGLIAETSHWPNGRVPFEIVGDFDAREMDLIEKAINAYHDNTCIKFMPRTTADENYVSIQSNETGCFSSVGMTGGKQVLNLQKHGCVTTVGTPIHELMHACGFTHEQNREERDEYVDILTENIQVGRENNFEKAAPGTTSGFGQTYDYGSVMHYSDHAFSVNDKPTIVSKKQFDGKMGQREGFSKKDIAKINKMYKCTSTTASSGYKPEISITDAITSGIDNIISMILPINDTAPTAKKGKPKKINAINNL